AAASARPQAPASGTGMPAAKSPLTAYRLKPGDPLVIYLRGIPGQEQQIEDIVDESGVINMPYINVVQAGGRTTTELEQTIRKAYLDQQIYKYITVNVVVPARSYFVKGEVRQPGRFPLVSGMTIVQAIAGAGGFSEFADRGNVEVIRGTRRFRVNVRELEQHPERDRELEAGDVITVQRSFF
ncbi:MAG: polysaccharide biosynthesis/export family protein, partial [Verrucomicrobiota bacterium]